MNESIRTSTEASDATTSRRWLALAVAVLVLAGALALALVVGRMPPFDRMVGDPLAFKRCLVVHVDLAIVAWFYAFAAALLSTAPRSGPRPWTARVAPFVAAAGIATMVTVAFATHAPPLLSNYVPMLDHPAYGAGLALFAGGVLLATADRALLPWRRASQRFVALPEPARVGLFAIAAAIVIATLTFAASWATRPHGVEPQTFYELLFWGTGHVLQLVSTTAMLTAWIVLLDRAGVSPLSRTGAVGLFGALLAPWTTAPLLALMGTQSPSYRDGFTTLMRLGIFPAVVAMLALSLSALRRGVREGGVSLRQGPVLGFLASAALTLLGFVLGALIRGSNTMIPGHYHASIGGVTAAFMTATYPLLESCGVPLAGARSRRVARVQPLVYAVGQAVFAVGFGFAGSPRKTYGSEQHARGAIETVGLFVMGAGGIVAIAGGLLFLFLVVHALRRAAAGRHASHAPGRERRRHAWLQIPESANTPSRN